MELEFVPEKEKELLRNGDKEGWIRYKAGLKAPGASIIGALLFIVFFFMGFLVNFWFFILAFVVLSISRGNQVDNYIKKSRPALESLYTKRIAEWNTEVEKQNQRKKLKAQGIPTCPKCMSEKVEIFTQISNSFSGKYEYGKPKMVCKVCGKVFNPGE